MPTDCFLGLISGTSADGIDAALVAFEPALQLVFRRTYAWDSELRERLVVLGQGSTPLTLDDIGELDTRIGRQFAETAARAISDSGIDPSRIAAIGSHGQTLRHRPTGAFPYTLQLGDPNSIVERSGCMVVADFRRRDVAAGGQGAPLMPAFHAAMLASSDESRAVLNLGGIANLTLLPKSGPVRGFDTGPANGLMDAWCRMHTGNDYDAGGEMAAAGRLDEALLQRLLDEPWFSLPPPKSTGRDHFHAGWLLPRLRGEAAADVQATLAALSARTIAEALAATQPDTERVIACGGGVHNRTLMDALAAELACPLESSAGHGLHPDFVEAMGFAWLARETLAGRPGNRPEVTGARGPRVLGAIYPR